MLPQLEYQVVSKIFNNAAELADNLEEPTNKLLGTPMFSIDHAGIAEEGNTPWNTIALPSDLEYEYSLAAPESDAHLGYSPGQSGWSTLQYKFISSLRAQPYAQPGKGSTFRFSCSS